MRPRSDKGDWRQAPLAVSVRTHGGRLRIVVVPTCVSQVAPTLALRRRQCGFDLPILVRAGANLRKRNDAPFSTEGRAFSRQSASLVPVMPTMPIIGMMPIVGTTPVVRAMPAPPRTAESIAAIGRRPSPLARRTTVAPCRAMTIGSASARCVGGRGRCRGQRADGENSK